MGVKWQLQADNHFEGSSSRKVSKEKQKSVKAGKKYRMGLRIRL